jgi:thiosulfate dehydrogenase
LRSAQGEALVLKGFVLGVVASALVGAAGAYWFVTSGAIPAGQDARPLPLERWAAKKSLRATLRRDAWNLKSPIQPGDEDLLAGAALFVAHCQVCHGGPDGAASSIARGLAPMAPQLARDGVEDDPEGTIYWKVAHGIRFTGMPGFHETLSEREMWQMTIFLKQMKSVPARQAWASTAKTP